MASIQTRLWNVNVGSLYYVISVVPFYGFGTGTLTSDKSSSTLALSDSSFSHISCFMFYIFIHYCCCFCQGCTLIMRGLCLFTLFVSQGNDGTSVRLGAPKPVQTPQWHSPLTVPRRYSHLFPTVCMLIKSCVSFMFYIFKLFYILCSSPSL